LIDNGSNEPVHRERSGLSAALFLFAANREQQQVASVSPSRHFWHQGVL
jgi:hypothetical protein